MFRHDSSDTSTLLKIESVGKNGSLFLITLKTTHHAFTQKKSSTVRSLNNFYYLQKTLKVNTPGTSVGPGSCDQMLAVKQIK